MVTAKIRSIMKKYSLLAIAALIALSAVSCTKEIIVPETSASAIKVNFSVGDLPNGTRSVKAGWENGDVINIWFDTNMTKTPDLTLTYQNGSWVNSEISQEIAQKLKEDGYLRFFWESSNSWDSWILPYSMFDNVYSPVSGKGFPLLFTESSNRTNNYYHFDEATQTLTASLQWQYRTNVQIVVEGITPADNYRLTCNGTTGLYTASFIEMHKDITGLSTGSTRIYGMPNGVNGTAFSLAVHTPGEREVILTLIAPDMTEKTYTVTRNFDFPNGRSGEYFFAARIPFSKFQ
jgi:hypothetical protein